MYSEDVIKIYESENALQRGHFKLSSGKHSSIYLQSAIVLSNPKNLNIIASFMVKKIKEVLDLSSVDLVVSPAMGGVIIGNKIGELLNKRSIFLERVEKIFTLRRGFQINKNDKVLIIEDVITTGKSSIESAVCVNDFGGKVIGLASIIDRSSQLLKLNFPFIPAAKIDAPIFDQDEIPDYLKNIPAVKPGSRFIK